MKNNIYYYREEYLKQRKLEGIVNSRVLLRPNVKKRQVVALFAICLFMICASVLAPILLAKKPITAIVLSVTANLILIETYFRFCLIILVKYYQNTAKEETRRRCLCIPSCSEYAIISLKKVFPLAIALLKIHKRLYKTCDGQDYKIDFPIRKMGEDFENKL